MAPGSVLSAMASLNLTSMGASTEAALPAGLTESTCGGMESCTTVVLTVSLRVPSCSAARRITWLWFDRRGTASAKRPSAPVVAEPLAAPPS